MWTKIYDTRPKGGIDTLFYYTHTNDEGSILEESGYVALNFQNFYIVGVQPPTEGCPRGGVWMHFPYSEVLFLAEQYSYHSSALVNLAKNTT